MKIPWMLEEEREGGSWEGRERGRKVYKQEVLKLLVDVVIMRIIKYFNL